MNIRNVITIVILSISGSLVAQAEWEVESLTPHRNRLNTVIGDAGFIAAFGRVPDDRDDEDLRIIAHLSYVEILLRNRPTDDLSPELRAERARNLDRLHQYRVLGIFPRNTMYRERRPCFIDNDGRICAVGYLVEQSAGRDVAEKINARFQYARIDEMRSTRLDGWLAQSGLTRQEAAMIQPTYGNFPLQQGAEPVRIWPQLLAGISVGGVSGIHTSYVGSSFGTEEGTEIDGKAGRGFSLGVNGAYRITPGSEGSMIILHLGYATHSATFEGSGYEGVVVTPSGTETTAPLQYHSDVTYSLAGGDIQYSMMLSDLLGISAGPSISYVIGPTRSEQLTPENNDLRFREDPGSTYANDGHTMILSDGTVPNKRPLRLGLTAGMYVQFDLGDEIRLRPSIAFDYGLTDVTTEAAWRVHTLWFGLDLAYAFLYAE